MRPAAPRRSLSPSCLPMTNHRPSSLNHLKASTHYVLTSEAGYQALYDFLTGQGAVEPRAIGPMKVKPRPVRRMLTFQDD